MIFLQDDDGNALDYSGDDFALTKQTFNIYSFQIKGDVSVNFSIPNNAQNRGVLGYGGFNQLNAPAFSKTFINVLKDGIHLMRGYIVIASDDGVNLEVFFISGNANWFSSFAFSCKEIRANHFNIQWTATAVTNTFTATEGIIFPVIDFMFRRLKYDKYFLSSIFSEARATELYPCLYVHTMVNLLSQVAGIKLDGTLFDDRLYKTLIITPSGPTLIDPETGLEISNVFAPTLGTGGNYIKPAAIAPDMQAIEVIKWLAISFGCECVFDVEAGVLNMNIIDKIEKEDADDWSDFVIDYQIKYDSVSEKNYIRVADPPEQEIQEYNEGKEVKFGELKITSLKDDGSVKELYTSPFLPSMDKQGISMIAWKTPYVEFFRLEDDSPIAYTGVTNLAGKARFDTAGGLPYTTAESGILFRIVDAAGLYDGYHTQNPIASASATFVPSQADYIGNSTGSIYPVRASKVEAGHRILVCVPNIDLNNISSASTFEFSANSGALVYTKVATAFYSKPFYNGPLDGYKQGLAYGDIDLPLFQAINLDRAYLKKVSKFVSNPELWVNMYLPEAVFKDFEFGQYIHLNTGDLNGYFYVNYIEQYKGSTEPVLVSLLKAE